MSKLENVRKSKETNLSLIWLLPLVALAITLWLGWQSYHNRGIIVHVEFENGSGIQANRTAVMYKGIEVGRVTGLAIDTDTRKVIATLEINKDAAPYLGRESLFWLVSPKVSLGGITGLETIVSGVYISVEPVSGLPGEHFTALKEAPSLLDNAPGLHLTLKADKLGSLDKGSPVYYKQLRVGQVKNYQLADDEQTVNVNVLINEPYEHLVSRQTRFWNASGITVTGGFSGFKIHTDSLVSIVSGGISFDTPEDHPRDDKPITKETPFRLYEDYVAAQAGIRVELELHELSGLTEGKTLIMNQGVQVGTLRRIKIEKEYKGAVAELNLDPRTEGLLNEGTEFWVVKPSISLTGISGLETLVRGNYIEVRFSKEGKPTRKFTIRRKAPPLNTDAPGLHLVLKSEQLGSVDVGSPVLYRQLKVGSVQSYQLSRDEQKVIIGIHIEPEYAKLVNESSRFWNVSGITLKGGMAGVEVKSESLLTLLAGGIAFDTPNRNATPINRVKAFPLYASEDKAKASGASITLKLENTEGITEGTPIRVRGMEVGRIESVKLTEDLSGIIAHARLSQGSDLITRSDSLFWIVKPELGLLKTANLGTLISGTYLEVSPGTTKARRKTTFEVPSEEPPTLAKKQSGLHVVLAAPRRGSLSIGTPVTYREIPVGKVTNFKLSPQADTVLIDILIEPKFAPLVRGNTRFWASSGIDIEAGLFKGVKIRTESLETIVVGGIAFATPEINMGVAATNGRIFILYEEPNEQWLKWAPKILLNP